MMAVMALGALLIVLGLGGAVNACMADAADNDTTVAMMAGLAFAIGLLMLGVGAASGGYHRKPLGAPPRDMDPAAAEEATPVNAEPGPAASPVIDGAAGLSDAPDRPGPPVPPVTLPPRH
jgi:hypothetical protein